MAAYFPDYAMLVNPGTLNINNTNDSGFAYVNIPSVKLYTDKVKFTATVSPTAGTGTDNHELSLTEPMAHCRTH